MKAFRLVVLILGLALPVFAHADPSPGRIYVVSSEDNAAVLLYPDSVKPRGDNIEARVVLVTRKPIVLDVGKVYVLSELMEFDCKGARSRPLQIIGLGLNLDSIHQMDRPGRWTEAAPGTRGGELTTAACSPDRRESAKFSDSDIKAFVDAFFARNPPL